MIKRESDEKKQQEFWKECGFDMNEEFKIYRFLCGNMSKRERKKWKCEKRFYSYWKWRSYVEEKLRNLNNPILCDEFAHYLNLRQEGEEEYGMTLSTFMIPAMAAIFASYIMKTVDSFSDINDGVTNIPLGVMTNLMIALALGIFVYIMLKQVIKSIEQHNMKKCFYKDYIQILENLYPKEISLRR